MKKMFLKYKKKKKNVKRLHSENNNLFLFYQIKENFKKNTEHILSRKTIRQITCLKKT